MDRPNQPSMMRQKTARDTEATSRKRKQKGGDQEPLSPARSNRAKHDACCPSESQVSGGTLGNSFPGGDQLVETLPKGPSSGCGSQPLGLDENAYSTFSGLDNSPHLRSSDFLHNTPEVQAGVCSAAPDPVYEGLCSSGSHAEQGRRPFDQFKPFEERRPGGGKQQDRGGVGLSRKQSCGSSSRFGDSCRWRRQSLLTQAGRVGDLEAPLGSESCGGASGVTREGALAVGASDGAGERRVEVDQESREHLSQRQKRWGAHTGSGLSGSGLTKESAGARDSFTSGSREEEVDGTRQQVLGGTRQQDCGDKSGCGAGDDKTWPNSGLPSAASGGGKAGSRAARQQVGAALAPDLGCSRRGPGAVVGKRVSREAAEETQGKAAHRLKCVRVEDPASSQGVLVALGSSSRGDRSGEGACRGFCAAGGSSPNSVLEPCTGVVVGSAVEEGAVMPKHGGRCREGMPSSNLDSNSGREPALALCHPHAHRETDEQDERESGRWSKEHGPGSALGRIWSVREREHETSCSRDRHSDSVHELESSGRLSGYDAEASLSTGTQDGDGPLFILSSGRTRARAGTRKPTIDDEFEQYFSQMLL